MVSAPLTSPPEDAAGSFPPWFRPRPFLLGSTGPKTPGVTVSPAEVELRCPTGPHRLFAKLRLAGEPTPVTSDNLIELSCADCRKRLSREGSDVSLVLHRYNVVGELVETVTV